MKTHRMEIVVPTRYLVEFPDDMRSREIKVRIWENIRDGTTQVWSSSGYLFRRGKPAKQADVFRILDETIGKIRSE